MYKTKDGKTINIEKLSWNETYTLLNRVCPELASVMKDITSMPEHVFYKASYPFGAKIIRESEVYLSLANGDSIAINSPDLPHELIDDLAYNPKSCNPLGMILSKNSEFYLPINQRIMPYMVVTPGDMFGLPRVLDNVTRDDLSVSSTLSFSTYNLCAGARSLFMLPKISDRIGHNKLKKEYGLTTDTPKSYMEHCHVFREIAKKAGCTWQAEILFFSNKWISKLKDPQWMKLFGFLSQKYRNSHTIWHNIQAWQALFSKIESSRYLEYYSAYTLDTARHLFVIAANSAPGFRPAMDEESAPIKLIQDTYVNHYGLNEYWPIIMEPAQSSTTTEPLYYSLSYATLPLYNPHKFKGKTIIALEQEVQHSAEIYRTGILSSNHSQLPASLWNAAEKVKFTCYHNDPRDYPHIKNSSLIAEEDQRFIHDRAGTFPSASTFLVGCVKIAMA